MLDRAFEALKKMDWGTPLGEVSAIEDAVATSHGDAALRQDLERRLIAALSSGISNDAKGYVCRKLSVLGSPAAVPALAALLSDEANAHLARQALERISAPAAAAALHEALAKLSGKLKIGVIGSLGARREAGAVPALAALLNDADATVARSAALALGAIGGPEAVAALERRLPAAGGEKDVLIDALLSCAESLRATRRFGEATAIYQSLSGDGHSRLVRLAADRGLLACLSQQA